MPVRDDRRLFEKIVLEGAQAGLSWLTILKRRENYRGAFDRFDIKTVAAYGDDDFERLINDAGIIRNRLKIRSAVNNAGRVLEVQKEYGSLHAFLWSFVGGRPVQNSWEDGNQVPVTTPESDAMSKALKKTGFSFIGSISCYALMQSCGMVNDHVVDCFRHREIRRLRSDR